MMVELSSGRLYGQALTRSVAGDAWYASRERDGDRADDTTAGQQAIDSGIAADRKTAEK